MIKIFFPKVKGLVDINKIIYQIFINKFCFQYTIIQVGQFRFHHERD